MLRETKKGRQPMRVARIDVIGVLIFFGVLFAGGLTSWVRSAAAQDAKKMITHFLAYDLDKKDFVPYENEKDVQIFVVGPDGVEPGVVFDKSEDGTQILVAPESLAKDPDPTPDPKNDKSEPLSHAEAK